MSVKVSSWVWHSDECADLGLAEMMVLLSLADVADDAGHVVFARVEERDQAAIARKAHMSVATFRRTIRTLEEKRLLEVVRDSRTTPNSYRITNATAQSERSPMSDRTAQSERSERSPVSDRSSLRRTDVVNVPEFERFWSIYPRHEAKKKAAEIFTRLLKSKVDPQQIIEGAERYREKTLDTEVRFIAHPSTWLNQARWEDEQAAAAPARVEAAPSPPVPVEHRRILWERNVPVEEYLDFRHDPVPGRFEKWWAEILKRPVVA